MTPSNPLNDKPLIYRIKDSEDVEHLVVPVNHTHEMSEVTGLTEALNNKAPKSVGTVLYGDGDPIDLEDVFTDGRVMQTWAVYTQQDNIALTDLFYSVSSGRLFFPAGDPITIPSDSWAAIRVIKTLDQGDEPVYLVILDGIYNDV